VEREEAKVNRGGNKKEEGNKEDSPEGIVKEIGEKKMTCQTNDLLKIMIIKKGNRRGNTERRKIRERTDLIEKIEMGNCDRRGKEKGWLKIEY
jgi:hypothetical protein